MHINYHFSPFHNLDFLQTNKVALKLI